MSVRIFLLFLGAVRFLLRLLGFFVTLFFFSHDYSLQEVLFILNYFRDFESQFWGLNSQ